MLALRFNTSALDEMFNLVNDFETPPDGNSNGTQRRNSWTPAVEVHETGDLVSMAVELPGVNPRDVQVFLQNGQLIIVGRKNPAIQDGQGAVRYSERWYGQFERTFAVPAGIEPNRIDASYDSGILTIRLHKSEQAKPRSIPITVGTGSPTTEITSGQK